MSKYCCRLCQEYKMAIVVNRSGVDSGEIDYSLPIEKFEKLSMGQLEDCIRSLKLLIRKCEIRHGDLDPETMQEKMMKGYNSAKEN